MKDLNIVVSGAAGQGVQTIGDVLSQTVSAHGYAVFTWKEYESRIRGGHNRYSIRISEKPRNGPLMEADVLLGLNKGSVDKYRPLLKKDGLLVSQQEAVNRSITISFMEIAREVTGQKIHGNTVALGALVSVLGMDLEVLNAVLARIFSGKEEGVTQANYRAAEAGYELAARDCKDMCPWELPRVEGRYYLLTANEAIPIAAAHAGCRFISAYPMTPSTGIITFLARNEADLGVFTEQAEDEIAAVNMAIGASYAGVRAMTATSGGGFALMVEGISLAGMTETPLVIVLAQRPGPATKLPTRTAQGDLLFAVHAGHDDFPKMVMAPSDPKDAFHKTIRAFNLADQYQIPVVILTDQFLADSRFSLETLDLEDSAPKSHLADPLPITRYGRYEITESGISPRLYPGQSDHLVCADSDEHDSFGHITEDLARTAPAMVEKRLNKWNRLKAEVNPPEASFLDDADSVLVGWGSSLYAMREAVSLLREDGLNLGIIHFTELWPLPEYRFPEEAALWTVESNSTGQLGRLLRSEYGVGFQGSIRRYDGLPLTADFIRRQIHAEAERL